MNQNGGITSNAGLTNDALGALLGIKRGGTTARIIKDIKNKGFATYKRMTVANPGLSTAAQNYYSNHFVATPIAAPVAPIDTPTPTPTPIEEEKIDYEELQGGFMEDEVYNDSNELMKYNESDTEWLMIDEDYIKDRIYFLTKYRTENGVYEPSPVYKYNRKKGLFINEYHYAAINAIGYPIRTLGPFTKRYLTDEKIPVGNDELFTFLYNFFDGNREDIEKSTYTTITLSVIDKDNDVKFITQHVKRRPIFKKIIDEKTQKKSRKMYMRNGISIDSLESFTHDMNALFVDKTLEILGSDKHVLLESIINPLAVKIVVGKTKPGFVNPGYIGYTPKNSIVSYAKMLYTKYRSMKSSIIKTNDTFNLVDPDLEFDLKFIEKRVIASYNKVATLYRNTEYGKYIEEFYGHEKIGNERIIDPSFFARYSFEEFMTFFTYIFDEKMFADLYVEGCFSKLCVPKCFEISTAMPLRDICEFGSKKLKEVAKTGILNTDESFFKDVCDCVGINLYVYQATGNYELTLLNNYITNEKFETFNYIFIDDHCYVIETKQNIIPKMYEGNTSILYVMFDIETLANNAKFQSDPIMISYLEFSFDARDHPVTLDDELFEFRCKQLSSSIHHYVGPFCIDDFLQHLMEVNKKYLKVCCFAYNGAKFDNFIVIDRYLENQYIEKKLETLFYDNTLFFTIEENIKFLDCLKYDTPNKLSEKTKANNKYFVKLTTGKYSFHQMNEIYNSKAIGRNINKFIKYMEDDDDYMAKFIEYCDYDVLGMTEWFMRHIRKNIKNGFEKPIHDFYTLGGQAIDMLKEKTGLKPFSLTNEQYERIVKTQYAGISYSAPGEYHDQVLADIVSQYPTTMIMDHQFPYCNHKTGDGYETEEDAEIINKMIEKALRKNKKITLPLGYGIVKNIDQRKLKSINVVQKRTKNGYDYDFKDIIDEAYLLSPTIELLMEYGCEFTIEKYYSFNYTEKGNILFKEFIEKPAREKTEQDIKKENGDPEYNNDTREFSKAIMNISTGKLAQKERDETFKIVTDFRGDITLSDNDLYYDIGDNLGMIKSSRPLEERKGKIRTFIPIAVLIYAYARKAIYSALYHDIMNPMIPSIIETDSITVPREQWELYACKTMRRYDVIKKKFVRVPCQVSPDADYKIFGQFEVEFVAETVITLQKKTYCMQKVDGYTKTRFKGIHQEGSVLCNDDKAFKLHKELQKCTNKIKKRKLKTEFYDYLGQLIVNGDVLKFDVDLYRRLLNKEKVFIIFSNLTKKTKEKGFKIVPVLGVKKLHLD